MQRWISAACACAWIFSFATASAGTPEDAPSTPPDRPTSRASLIPSADPSSVLSEATRLHDAGNAREAYELLCDHEAALAGTPEFDYLFGIVALDSHHPKEAVFAL